jgi:hypothetical protein
MIKGEKQLHIQFKNLQNLSNDSIKAGLEKLAEYARELVPVKTGFLRDSIEVTDNELIVAADYAAAVEFNIHPFVRPAIDSHRLDIAKAVAIELDKEVKKI